MANNKTVEPYPGFRVNMPMLIRQRRALYAMQQRARGIVHPSALQDLDGVIELLHSIEEAWDERSGKNDRLRRRMDREREKRLKARRSPPGIGRKIEEILI